MIVVRHLRREVHWWRVLKPDFGIKDEETQPPGIEYAQVSEK